MLLKVNIKENSWLAKIAAWKLKTDSVAIVFGRTIHLWKVDKVIFLQNKKWVLHELEHVRQYQELGFLRFISFYLWESLNNGYYYNRFEIAARQAEEAEKNQEDFVF